MLTDYKKIEANIYNHSFWVKECEPDVLKNRYENALLKSEFIIVLFNDHHFDNQGYTCFWLLAESHLAIHTFPESNKTYIELSSCNENKLQKFKSLL